MPIQAPCLRVLQAETALKHAKSPIVTPTKPQERQSAHANTVETALVEAFHVLCAYFRASTDQYRLLFKGKNTNQSKNPPRVPPIPPILRRQRRIRPPRRADHCNSPHTTPLKTSRGDGRNCWKCAKTPAIGLEYGLWRRKSHHWRRF